MTKSAIRKKYSVLRAALSNGEIDKLSQKIAARFLSATDFSKISVVHTFLPIISKKEVNTWMIIDELKKRYPRIRISIPKVEGKQLVNFYFESRSQLTENQWRILEPVSGERTVTKEIDLVLVPLLAFDRRGDRVGYGKGFYDKLLAECRGDCQKVGLSFFGPTNDLIPVDSFDIPLDCAITPEQILSFT